MSQLLLQHQSCPGFLPREETASGRKRAVIKERAWDVPHLNNTPWLYHFG